MTSTPNEDALSSQDQAKAVSFFGKSEKLRDAYASAAPHVQQIAVAFFKAVSSGYGEVRSVNMAEFRLYQGKTYCSIRVQRRAVKLSIDCGTDTNTLPTTPLQALTDPRPLGNPGERFVDYKIVSLNEVPHGLILIKAAYNYWYHRTR